MAKLRKRQKRHPESPASSTSDARKTDSRGPPALPVIREQSAFETQRLRQATNHPRPHSDSPVRRVVPERERPDPSKSNGVKSSSPPSQLLKTEPRIVPTAQRRASPLRIWQEAAPESEIVASGPFKSQPEYQRERCGGPSCQKCGRPRKPFVPDTSNDAITPAPLANWPLPGPTNKDGSGTFDSAIKEERVREARPQEPTATPSNHQQAKRRKYFSLPTKSKPSFKGPTELASVKGKAVEPRNNPGPGEEKQRPVSAPSPTKSAFKGPADLGSSNPQPKATVHVRFATDEHLGRFAGIISAQEASSARIQALRSLASAPAVNTGSHVTENPMYTRQNGSPPQVPQPHPQALVAAQPAPRANAAILYEWPLATTLVNRPDSNPRTRRPAVKSIPSHPSLSIFKRPSHRTVQPYTNPHINRPLPTRRTSSRYKTLRQQSRKVSYIVDHASNSSRDSMSIQILERLQGFPGGELAATANTEPDHKPLSERPSLLRLQTYLPDIATDNRTLNVDATDEELTGGAYSPSDYSSGEGDDDDQPMPVTPPRSDFPLASYSIGDDKKTNLRPASTVTQTSFSIGDDKHLPLRKRSELELAPAPPSGPSSASGESQLASAESPPSAPSTSQPPAHPLTLTPSPDSEGMIPVHSRLSMVDLPEVISNGSGEEEEEEEEEEEIDPDWFRWGALPGSYGGAGMCGASSAGWENGGPVELGVAS